MSRQEVYPVVILAGGLATRLRPLTETIPKSLIDVNGEPFIFHQLRALQQQGVKQVVLCLGYLGDMLQAIVKDGQQFGMNIAYSFDGEKLLGTGGAIKNALPLLTDNFFVLYGDSYLLCNFSVVQSSFQNQKRDALMTVFKNQGQWDTSNVEFFNNKIVVYDKLNRNERMHFIDYGLGVFNKRAFNVIHDNEQYDLANLYQELLLQNQLAACEVTERFYEIGSFSGIDDIKTYLRGLKCNL